MIFDSDVKLITRLSTRGDIYKTFNYKVIVIDGAVTAVLPGDLKIQEVSNKSTPVMLRRRLFLCNFQN